MWWLLKVYFTHFKHNFYISRRTWPEEMHFLSETAKSTSPIPQNFLVRSIAYRMYVIKWWPEQRWVDSSAFFQSCKIPLEHFLNWTEIEWKLIIRSAIIFNTDIFRKYSMACLCQVPWIDHLLSILYWVYSKDCF